MTTSNSNTSSQSTTAPGAAAQPIVQGITNQLDPLVANSGITGTQQTAINQLTANGMAGDQFAPAEATNANTLLNGGGATSQNGALSGNLSTLQSELGNIATPGYSTVNSQPVQQALQAANAQIGNSVNSQFAAAGRSGSGANAGNLAYNEELADAPLLLNQANTDTQNQMNAANTLYGAGNTTSNALTTNNQTALGNEQAGNTGATSAIAAQNEGPTAAIEAQELGQQIPAQNLGLLAQIGIPLAGLNTTTNGTSNTNTTPSILQDITGVGSAIGSLGTGLGSSPGAMSASGAVSNGSGILGLLGAL
jgi:hypothetical protein